MCVCVCVCVYPQREKTGRIYTSHKHFLSIYRARLKPEATTVTQSLLSGFAVSEGGTDKLQSRWLCECEQCDGWEAHRVQWGTEAGRRLDRGRHRMFSREQYSWPLNNKGLNCEVHSYLNFFQQIQTPVLHSPLLFESTGVETQIQTANCKVMHGFSTAGAGLVPLSTGHPPPVFKGRLCA